MMLSTSEQVGKWFDLDSVSVWPEPRIVPPQNEQRRLQQREE